MSQSPARRIAVCATTGVHTSRVELLLRARRPDLTLRRATDLEAALELVGQGGLRAIVVELDLPGIDGDLDTFRRLLAGAGTVPVVVLATDDDLGARAVEAGAVDHVDPVRDRPASAARAVAYAVERDEATAALRRRNAALEKANRALTRHARALSHDVKSPLAVAISAFETVSTYGHELADGEADRLFEVGIRQLRDLAEHLDALLDEVVLDGPARTSEVDPVEVVQWALGALSLEDRARTHLQIDQVPRVPAMKTAMRQVFQNLLANSLRHNPDGPVAIRLSGEVEGDRVLVRIEDDGDGFPDDVLSLVEDGRSGSGSSGLGLMTVVLGVARMGGTVGFGRGELGGACVTLALPRESGHQVAWDQADPLSVVCVDAPDVAGSRAGTA